MTDYRQVDKGKQRARGRWCWGRRHRSGGQSDVLLKCFLARLSGKSPWLKVLCCIDILSLRGRRTLSIIAECKHSFLHHCPQSVGLFPSALLAFLIFLFLFRNVWPWTIWPQQTPSELSAKIKHFSRYSLHHWISASLSSWAINR